MARYVGIDPGISGSVAIYDTVGPSDAVDLPTIGEGPGEMLDAKILLRTILVWCPDLIICERAQSMPEDGASRAFKYGKGFGQLLAVVQITGVPWTLVSPRVWKKHFNLSKDKELSRALALQKFPELHEKLKFKYTHQRAEALLIAMYGAIDTRAPKKKKQRDNTSQIDLEDAISGG